MKSSHSTVPVDRIPVRKPIVNLKKETPVHWLDGNIFKTHLANSLSLLFPDAESYFIRTAKSFLAQVPDPKLKKDILAFIGQETQHKRTHEKTWILLEDQGFRIRPFLESYNYLSFQVLEKLFPPKLNLSIVAGLEHFTALLSELVLSDQLMKNSEPLLREIFEWHCAEELEHKHVAFDLFESVSDDYKLRIFGILIASFLLMGYSITGILVLVAQDDSRDWLRLLGEAKDFLFSKDRVFGKGFSSYLDYFKPSFHPNQRDTKYMQEEVLRNLKFEPILNKLPANVESREMKINLP